MDKHFMVIFRYEKNSASRRRNIKRLQTVKSRLIEQGIQFENHGYSFDAERIPNNIKRLIYYKE